VLLAFGPTATALAWLSEEANVRIMIKQRFRRFIQSREEVEYPTISIVLSVVTR
jgi:hypothetical protein